MVPPSKLVIIIFFFKKKETGPMVCSLDSIAEFPGSNPAADPWIFFFLGAYSSLSGDSVVYKKNTLSRG